MDAVVNSNRSVVELLEREARDTCARSELYGLLHFRLHPAARIAQRLAEMIAGRDRREIVKALEDSAPTGRNLWAVRLELMLHGDRAPYRRGKGYAALLIDTVAYAIGIMEDVPSIVEG